MTKYLSKWVSLGKHAKSDMLFTTIIISALPISDNNDWESIASRIETNNEKFKDDFRNLVRLRAPQTQWRGAIEYDLMMTDKINTHHKALLDDMGVDASSSTHLLIPHVHMVVKPTISRDKWKERLETKWRGRWRVMNKSLYEDQTVMEALTNLHNYCHKQRLQYGDGGYGGEQRKYKSDYEPSWKQRIGSLYGDKCDFNSKM